MGSIHPTKKRDYGKHTRIDPDQSYQLAYWKQRFGKELIEACERQADWRETWRRI